MRGGPFAGLITDGSGNSTARPQLRRRRTGCNGPGCGTVFEAPHRTAPKLYSISSPEEVMAGTPTPA